MKTYYRNPQARTVAEFLELSQPSLFSRIKRTLKNFLWIIPILFLLAQGGCSKVNYQETAEERIEKQVNYMRMQQMIDRNQQQINDFFKRKY